MVNDKGFLIDTQIFIWWMEKSKRLSEKSFDLLNDPQNKIFLSVASVWEIVIKKGRRKLEVPKDVRGGIEKSGFIPLPIEVFHVLGVEKLPHYHKDPFDRILISQAKVEDFTLITSDEKIWKYDLSLLKA